MTPTSCCNDLTIPELFHALKQQLYGVSLNCTRYTALLNPWGLRRMTLAYSTSSNSLGLDYQEVREIGNGIVDDLSTALFRQYPLIGARSEEPFLSHWLSPRGSARKNPHGAGFGMRPAQGLTRLPSLARHPRILPAPLDQLPMR